MAASVAYVGARGATCSCAASPTARSACSRTARPRRPRSASSTSSRGTPTARIATIQRPYAEIDYKTSGGHDSYNAMQLSLTRRRPRGLAMNAQYTLGYSKGNTGGSNEARDRRQQRPRPRRLRLRRRLQQLRRPAYVQPEPALHDPGHGALHGRLVGRRHRQRAQRPADSGARSRATTSSTSTAAGIVWNNAAAGSHGGDQHAGRRRRPAHAPAGPDPGRDPFIKDGGRCS